MNPPLVCEPRDPPTSADVCPHCRTVMRALGGTPNRQAAEWQCPTCGAVRARLTQARIGAPAAAGPRVIQWERR